MQPIDYDSSRKKQLLLAGQTSPPDPRLTPRAARRRCPRLPRRPLLPVRPRPPSPPVRMTPTDKKSSQRSGRGGGRVG